MQCCVLLLYRRISEGKIFSPHRAELHRIDAVVSERLTSSPYVANIYGFCGQSAINELARASGRALRGGRRSPQQKLQFAIDVALGIATAHEIEKDGKVSLVHRDVRSTNFLMTNDGKHLMLHDFNCARLMTWDSKNDVRCAFYKPECVEVSSIVDAIKCNSLCIRLCCNISLDHVILFLSDVVIIVQNRSPEECSGKPLTEKIDVYSMGNVLYVIATSRSPYGYPRKYSLEEVEKLIINGTTPEIPQDFVESEDPATQAILSAMRKCYAYDPADRPSAREIALELQGEYNSLYCNNSEVNS